MGISQLTFGHKAGSQSIFWKNPSAFAGKMANRGRLSEISGKNFRQRMTTSNRFKYGTSPKKGFNLRKNQKDFHITHNTPHWSREKKWGGLKSGRTAQSERERKAKHGKEIGQGKKMGWRGTEEDIRQGKTKDVGRSSSPKTSELEKFQESNEDLYGELDAIRSYSDNSVKDFLDPYYDY